jgi:hypothetical protein
LEEGSFPAKILLDISKLLKTIPPFTNMTILPIFNLIVTYSDNCLTLKKKTKWLGT